VCAAQIVIPNSLGTGFILSFLFVALLFFPIGLICVWKKAKWPLWMTLAVGLNALLFALFLGFLAAMTLRPS
jgi:VIT1/CCC1 family predicted Fe2+/Mn2+ transporter